MSAYMIAAAVAQMARDDAATLALPHWTHVTRLRSVPSRQASRPSPAHPASHPARPRRPATQSPVGCDGCSPSAPRTQSPPATRRARLGELLTAVGTDADDPAHAPASAATQGQLLPSYLFAEQEGRQGKTIWPGVATVAPIAMRVIADLLPRQSSQTRS